MSDFEGEEGEDESNLNEYTTDSGGSDHSSSEIEHGDNPPLESRESDSDGQ